MATPSYYGSQLDFPLARLNLGVAVVFGVLALGAFVLRVIARRRTKAPLQSDDWVICIAMVSCYHGYPSIRAGRFW